MLFAEFRPLCIPSVCLLFVAGACDLQPTEPVNETGFELASAAASVNSKSMERQVIPVPLDFQTVFTCEDRTEHTMWLFGEIVRTIHRSVDGRGRTHVSFHDNPDVYAMDELGRMYRGGASKLNLTTKGADAFHQTQSIRLIGKGKAPNFHLHLVGHQSTNGNGEVTVDFSRSRVSCR